MKSIETKDAEQINKQVKCICLCHVTGLFAASSDAAFCLVGSTERKPGKMETRVALIGIIVENPDSVGELNSILHEYGAVIIGRMGIPYRECGISIISIAVDAPQDVISALTGKIGRLTGISTKTAYSNVIHKRD